MRLPWLRRLLRWRGLQPALMLAMLFFFVLAVLTGFLGTAVGSRNFAIIFVWIVWWGLLTVVFIPLGGRVWCLMCPIPAPGEWLQRRAIVGVRPGRPFGLGLKWPRWLDNLWPQNITFSLVAVFSVIILTRPWASAAVLLLFGVLAVALSLIFRGRAFCRYVCPVGGFITIYSLDAPLELRPRDYDVCRQHREKECYFGSDEGYGCPWLIRPFRLRRNAYCGLCTECLKTCPKDNLALRLRPFGRDLLVAEERRLDEAYMMVAVLMKAILYPAVLLGPWGWVKDWANSPGWWEHTTYAVAFLSINLLLFPALFFVFTLLSKWLSRTSVSVGRLFVDYAYALAPLGLMGWMAFSFAFVFVNGSYALPTLSDPFGWGWNLFGTRDFPWTPLLPGLVQPLQVAALVGGLVFSLTVAWRIAQQHGGRVRREVTPIAVFLTGVTIVFLRLYLG